MGSEPKCFKGCRIRPARRRTVRNREYHARFSQSQRSRTTLADRSGTIWPRFEHFGSDPIFVTGIQPMERERGQDALFFRLVLGTVFT